MPQKWASVRYSLYNLDVPCHGSHWIPTVILQKEIPWRKSGNSFVMFDHWKPLTGECRRLGDFRAHIWATLSRFRLRINSGFFFFKLTMPGKYILYELIYKKESTRYLSKARNQEASPLQYSALLYSSPLEWKSTSQHIFQVLFTEPDRLWALRLWWHCIWWRQGNFERHRVCSQMPHGLVKSKGIRNFGISKRSNRGVCPVLWEYVFYLLTLSTEVRGSFMNAVLGCVILWHVWDFLKK